MGRLFYWKSYALTPAANEYFYDTAFIKRLKIDKNQLLEYKCKIKKLFNKENKKISKNQVSSDTNKYLNETHKCKKRKVK